MTVTIDGRPGQGVALAWREHGGPPVRPPLHRGFGSVIIERTVPFELQGTADIRYVLGGFEADFFIPVRYVHWNETGGTAKPAGPALSTEDITIPSYPRPLEALGVLLLEDNMIAAMAAEDLLHELGAKSVWAVSTVAAAAQTADSEPVGFAMLDINLGTETSLMLAADLHARGIPVLFASGYGDDIDLGGIHTSLLTIKKPYLRDQLSKAIVQTLHAPAQAAAQ